MIRASRHRSAARTGRLVLALAAVLMLGSCGYPSAGHRGAQNGASSLTASTPSWVSSPSLTRCPAAAPVTRADLPSTTLRCLGDGPALSLARLPARPYVVNLWASWCIPCQREAPRFAAAIAAAHGDVGFIGVDTEDDRGSALDFLHHFGIVYPQLADPNGDVLHRLPAPGLPVTLAVNADGRIVYRRIGEISTDQLTAALQAVDPQLTATSASPAGPR